MEAAPRKDRKAKKPAMSTLSGTKVISDTRHTVTEKK